MCVDFVLFVLCVCVSWCCVYFLCVCQLVLSVRHVCIPVCVFVVCVFCVAGFWVLVSKRDKTRTNLGLSKTGYAQREI